jgi:hypothetical protein
MDIMNQIHLSKAVATGDIDNIKRLSSVPSVNVNAVQVRVLLCCQIVPHCNPFNLTTTHLKCAM